MFNTKPLPVIWGMFPELCTPENTIMFDDIRTCRRVVAATTVDQRTRISRGRGACAVTGRNFIMNPENGLKVSHPY